MDRERMANSDNKLFVNRSAIGWRSREAAHGSRRERESVACHKLAQIFTQLA